MWASCPVVWETNTMHPISIKAMLISDAVQFGMTLAMFFAAASATVGVAWGLAGFPAESISNALRRTEHSRLSCTSGAPFP
jgi:hypothetical protein